MSGEGLQPRLRPVFWMGVFLLLASPELLAQKCFSQAPSLQGGQDPYQAIASTRLSKEGGEVVEKLSKRIKGRWAGDAEGFFCRGKEGAPREEADRYRIVMDVTTDGSEELLITSYLSSKDNKTNRTERLRLILSSNSLRANRNDRAGEVNIMAMPRNGKSIEFLHKSVRPGVTGGAGFTEILRRIKVSATTLTIVFEVYTKGGLTSGSTWKLRKK